MRHFKIFQSAGECQVHIAVKQRKIVGICTVLDSDADQLHRQALAAYRSIQGRREHRCEDHGLTVLGSCAHKVLNNLPVALGEDITAVVVCQTIRMEPLRQDQTVLGQLGVQNFNGQHLAAQLLALAAFDDQCDGILSGRHLPVGVNADPHAAQLITHEKDGVVVVDRLQKVGVKPRRGAQIVVIYLAVITGHQHRNLLHRAQGNIGLELTFDLNREAIGVVIAIQAIHQLEGIVLIFQHGCPCQRRKLLGHLVKKAFFKGRSQARVKKMHVRYLAFISVEFR